MKKLSFALAAMLMAATAQAQIKVGANPTTIGANSNLETEAADGTKTVIQKDNGNLLIGTTIHDADAKLQVTSKAPKITPRVNHSIFQSLNATAPSQLFIHQGHNGSSPYFNFQSVEATVGNVPLSLQADGGNVGIGTTTPTHQLNVAGNSAAVSIDRFGGVPHLVLRQAQGTQAAPAATPTATLTGRVSGWSSDGSTYMPNGFIDFITTEAQTATTRGGAIKFETIANGTTSNLERMRIDHNGNVGIGTTTPLERLHVDNGNVFIGNYIVPGATRQKLTVDVSYPNNPERVDLFGVDNPAINTPAGGVRLAWANNNAEMQVVRGTSYVDGAGLAFTTSTAEATPALERMRITSNGNVGIGTTTPAAKLHVQSSSGGEAMRLESTVADPVVGANYLTFYNGATRTGYIGDGLQSSADLIFNSDGNGLRFLTGSNNSTAYMAANGNVGIGTTTPGSVWGSTLDVRNSAGTGSIVAESYMALRPTTDETRFILANSHLGAATAADWQLRNAGKQLTIGQTSWTTDPQMTFFDMGSIGIGGSNSTTNPIIYAKYTSPTDQKVGIGTTTPMGKLDVVDANNINRISIKGDFNFNYSPSNNHFGTNVYFDGSAFKVIDAASPVAFINTSINGSIAFQTQAASATFAPTSKMLLTNDGNLGIGSGMTPAHPIHLLSGAHVTTAGVWTNASDARLKTNIQNGKYGLAEVMKLRPVSYNMRKNGEAQVGFIAQEVQKIIPEVVSGKEGDISKGETLGISYGNMVAVLTKAIQEQQAEIESLKAKNGKLTAQVSELETLKAEVASIKAAVATAMLATGNSNTKAAEGK